VRVITTRQFFFVASLIPLLVPVFSWLCMQALQLVPGPLQTNAAAAEGVLGLVSVSGLLSTPPYGLYLAFVWMWWRPTSTTDLLSAVVGAIVLPPAILWLLLSLFSRLRPMVSSGTTLFWVEIAILVAIAYACIILLAFAVAHHRRWIREA